MPTMAAATTQYAQLPGGRHLMPALKTGTDFLASSHFSITQDPTITASSLKSVFKKDYTPWTELTRPPPAEPPRPAHVLHKDDRHFNDKASEMTKAFQFRAKGSLVRPDMTDVSVKLRSTNFKTDRDLSKFDSFDTSYALDFYLKDFQGVPKSMPKENPMESSIPQGDPEKTAEMLSDYRHRFTGHDALTTKPDRAPCMHQVSPSTIKGDGRLTHFDTTHNHQFRGVSFPPLTPFPPPRGTYIPLGDKSKEATLETVHQASFRGHDVGSVGPYEKGEMMEKLGRTNFRLQDGHGTFDTYMTTAKDCYQAVRSTLNKSAPVHHRNHSDLPGGDLDPRRVSERVGTTTNRYYHDKMPHYGPADIISGANRRTTSNVCFGEPRLGEKYYDTTTRTVFQPATAPYNLPSPDMTTKSHVPLHYYANEQTMATTWSDYQNPNQGKTLPHEQALANLKNSHIHAPLGAERQFTTEHLDQYVPKSSQHVPIDGGLLQRSTVPLGTLKIH